MDIKLACSHEHSLSNYYLIPEISEEHYLCDVCGKEISGEGYTCRRCEVWLHESCANELRHLPQEIVHPLHSQHHLKLQLERPWDFICDKCLYISAGSRYNCSSCDFILDLTCASSANDSLPKEKWQRLKDGEKKEIQHYSHNEMLSIFKYRKIKEDDYNCSWCEKRLSEVCYGCLRCKFFLHELCEIPRTLDHPFHPSHPLRLHSKSSDDYCTACGVSVFYRTNFSPWYWCEMCTFRLDFHCAKLLPTLKHKCHNHLLTYFGNISINHQRERFQCNACHELCGANFYRCVPCNFNIHLQCVPIPSSTKHRYHRHPLIYMDSVKEDDSREYFCDVCEDERNPMHPVYCCRKCTYIAHIQCVLNEDKISSEMVSPSAPQSIHNKALLVKEMEHSEGIDGIHTRQQLLIQPIIHEHPMKFSEKVKKNRYCSACRLVVTDPCYICTTCPDPYQKAMGFKNKYFLHEKCANLPYEIQHPFHSSHHLNLYTRPHFHIGLIICDECRDMCFGFVYLCEKCNFKLDMKCATLTARKTGFSQLKEMERVTELHHFSHHHKLVLGNSSDPIGKIECTICQLPILGPAYLCPLSGCFHVVHESCLGLPQKIQVPFHFEHMLIMRWDDQRYPECYACRPLQLSSFHLRYTCEHCDIKLHSICANSLRRPLKCESHTHNLYYFGANHQLLFANVSRERLFCCSKCQKSCGGPFYRCLECVINFHLECVPIPHIVKSSYHIHSLTMKVSFVEDDLGEYYCDICEEERGSNDHIYCCEECNDQFVAHIECVLAKVENTAIATYASSILELDFEKNSAQADSKALADT